MVVTVWRQFPDQRSIMAADALEIRARISRAERAKAAGQVGGKIGGRNHPKESGLAADLAAEPETKHRDRGNEARGATAKDHKISERKLRNAAEIKKLTNNFPGLA